MSAGAIPPAVIAAAVAEVRALLRLEGAGEQALLERLAATAIALGEAFTGTLFVRRTMEDVLSGGSAWQLLRAMPVSAIAGVAGLPADGPPYLLPTAGYAIDIDAEGRGWVKVSAPGAAGRLAVTYTAGLSPDWVGLPAPIAQGVVALAAHLFADRETARQPPAAVAALWRPYRRMRLAQERRA